MELVKLRVYKGKESYDKQGNLISDSQTVKLFHGTLEWNNFKKNAKVIYTNAVVEGLFNEKVTIKTETIKGKEVENQEFEYISKEIPQELKDEVRYMFENEVILSPEERRIQELEAKLDALMNGSKSKKETKKAESKTETKEPNTEVDEELEVLRDEYKEVVGKKPSHLMKAETLRNKINEAKS